MATQTDSRFRSVALPLLCFVTSEGSAKNGSSMFLANGSLKRDKAFAIKPTVSDTDSVCFRVRTPKRHLSLCLSLFLTRSVGMAYHFDAGHEHD